MYDERIAIKGNKDGFNVIIQMDKFGDFNEMLEALLNKLKKGKNFFTGANLIITTELNSINERQAKILKDSIFDQIAVKNCEFRQKEENVKKVFDGVYEGRTKFIRTTVRGGQMLTYPGNIIIVGDVNHGAEVKALGNIIVLGSLNGRVYAGDNGNEKSIIEAFSMSPELLSIAGKITVSPDNFEKSGYPEVASLKDGEMILEPYLPDKYIY